MRPAVPAWLLLLLLAGCAGLPPPASFPVSATQAPSRERAEAAIQRSDHAQAAAIYEALAARAAAPDRAGLQLSAARSWLNAGRSGEASRIITTLGGTLTPEQTLRRQIIDADITLASGQTQQAWTRITAINEPADTALGLEYLDSRMRIALAAARPVDSVRAEISAERLVSETAQRTRLRSQLLAQLRLARDRGVKLEAAASQDATIRGWLDLGAVASNTRGVSLTGGSESARWRARYPGHPATELLSEALPPALTGSGTVARIALLLPIGRSEGQTIRDGFRHALAQLPAGSQPELQVYDTGTQTVAALIQQARADGNGFIVGPLTREEVTAAAATGSPPVPMLALNFLAGDSGAPRGFYQFALSPEDEARAVARRVLASGQRRGIAIAPADDWGNRVLAAFTQELLAGGGTLLSQVSYDPSTHDFGEPIKRALGTSESLARRQRLQSMLGTRLEFEPRRRADIEFIFAAGMSTNARLLRPQLRFQYAGEVPVYATSAAYAPEAGTSNRDLDGLQYPDMPWLLPDASIDSLRQSAEQSGFIAAGRSRLFAFGYDACQLALAIAASGQDPRRVLVSGLTGQLSVDADGRVHRELEWARVSDGQPQLLGAPTGLN